MISVQNKQTTKFLLLDGELKMEYHIGWLKILGELDMATMDMSKSKEELATLMMKNVDSLLLSKLLVLLEMFQQPHLHLHSKDVTSALFLVKWLDFIPWHGLELQYMSHVLKENVLLMEPKLSKNLALLFVDNLLVNFPWWQQKYFYSHMAFLGHCIREYELLFPQGFKNCLSLGNTNFYSCSPSVLRMPHCK